MNLFIQSTYREKGDALFPDAYEYRDRADHVRNAMPNHAPSSHAQFSFTIRKLVHYRSGESIHRRFTHKQIINDRGDSG